MCGIGAFKLNDTIVHYWTPELGDKVMFRVFIWINSTAGITECIRKNGSSGVCVGVGPWSGLRVIGVRGVEVEAAAFEHDQGDEVAEVPVTVADLDGGLDLVVDGLQASVG